MMPTDTQPKTWNFENTYRTLPDKYFSAQLPVPVQDPQLVVFNAELARELGLGFLIGADKQVAAFFSGNELPPGAEPIAQAYAGHQFGHFTILGDGRAVLLGEQMTPDHRRLDIQLKGSGPTPYSRRGDGRATLRAMLREYLMSEALHYLGIPTSRSLAVVRTGDPVYREVVQAGAVLTRVAASHIRVGTFEYAKQFCTPQEQQQLLDYVIARHYPSLTNAPNPALELLRAVMERQADLLAHWMRVGFIHGVMNTDNMSIAGETIDYGPCAFLNQYDLKTVFSSIDTAGRYAFGNQPAIAHWNLAVLAGALLPLINPDETQAIALAQGVLDEFANLFSRSWHNMMFRKLGIEQPVKSDADLVHELLNLMQEHQADYINTFLLLQTESDPEPSALSASPAFQEWHRQWKARLEDFGGFAAAVARMQPHNPVVIPRNHLVEAALDAADQGDMTPFNALLETLREPYKPQAWQTVPADFDNGYRTFCGT